MKNMFDNSSKMIQIWIFVGMLLLFIITLPIMIMVMPVVAAWEVSKKFSEKNNKKKKPFKPMNLDTLFGDTPNIFGFGFGDWEKN